MIESDAQHHEEVIRNVEAAYDYAWRSGDVESILACLTNDALLISPRGDEARGRQEIRRLLSEFLAGPAKGTTHSSRIIRVSFVTDDVAIVDGEAKIEGGDIQDLSTVAHHMFTDVLLRIGDDWRIAHIRAYATRRL